MLLWWLSYFSSSCRLRRRQGFACNVSTSQAGWPSSERRPTQIHEPTRASFPLSLYSHCHFGRMSWMQMQNAIVVRSTKRKWFSVLFELAKKDAHIQAEVLRSLVAHWRSCVPDPSWTLSINPKLKTKRAFMLNGMVHVSMAHGSFNA